MDILELIEKRAACAFGGNRRDEMLVEASKSKDRNIAVILTENDLTRYHGENIEFIIALRENNRLKGMFDLGVVLPKINANLILYIFTKDRPNSFTVGEYHGVVLKRRIKADQSIDWKSIYPNEYYDYLHKIEKWVESGDIDSDEYASFNVVRNELFEGVFAPKRYSKNVYRVKAALEVKKTVRLSEVADIIIPRPERDKLSMQLPVSEWKYPIDYSSLREGVLTNTPLKKNDILFRDFERVYLLEEEPQQEIHISPNFCVIRPKKILPQYLIMYLQSNTAKIIMQSVSMGNILSRIRMSDMRNIPIVLPRLSDEEYIQTFRLKNYKPNDIAEYSRTTRRLTAYMRELKPFFEQKEQEKKKKDTVENILEEEWAQNIRVCKTEVMQEFLESDIKELNVCFRGKAYKATLILAGSILEAVLIDWLTEIKGINYFDEPYIIRKEQWDKRNNCVKRDNNGNILYYNKEAGLADYIDEIKELARPAWMKSHQAHEIRKKRNLVHAKLCMNDTTEINEQTCREVIQYLKEVIETRGIQQN